VGFHIPDFERDVQALPRCLGSGNTQHLRGKIDPRHLVATAS
jgi:hypothetical protein